MVTKAIKKNKLQSKCVCYGLDLKKYKDINDGRCFAYTKQDDHGNDMYFIRRGTGKQCNGRYLNPFAVFYNVGDEFKDNPLVGKRLYEFKKVTKQMFDFYLNFLRTRNVAWLQQCERTLI